MQPTLFLSHGSPMLALQDIPARQFLQDLGPALDRPDAILVISAHWETDVPAVNAVANNATIHDFYGFPPALYQLAYPAPGAPDLARRTADLIAGANLPTRLDDRQGFDHGTFVPAYVMYPTADVPVYQVSLRHDYDPAAHFALGRALAPLRDEGVLIVGSGLSYHNLRLFGPGAKVPSDAFDSWLDATLRQPQPDRTNALLDWESAPYARTCHAQEDHLVPLFAALGAAEGEAATRTYHDTDLFGGVTASSWRFGG